MQDFWIIISVAFIGISASLLGAFLLFRKMTMLTDAIAHSILPGIVIAYLLSGTKNILLTLVVATLFGVLTSFLASWIEKKIPSRQDAATGISFTFLFALGIIMVTLFAEQTDLDQECVLFGEMLYIPFDTLLFNTLEIPRAFLMSLLVLVVVFTFTRIAYRYLFFITFDSIFSASIGISITLWHYVHVTLVSLVSVASFELLGSVLVIAMFVFPPATAFLISRNFFTLLLYTLFISVISVILGYYFSVWQLSSAAASIVLVQGVIFSGTLILHRNLYQKTS
ncbi:MAG: metal ABC transporter permease [Thermonemataceae bacterium]|nr:metal ABC transporter permease [Thermonemataceae bacterium]